MKDIKDPTTQLRPWPHVSSDWGQAHLELGISTPPPQVEESLPERYGIAQLEVLIVDPEYLFLSWEVTEEQLQEARQQLGNQSFQTRRLVAVIENLFGSVLAEYELYGEQGRWFIRHSYFGEEIRVRLLFKARQCNFELYLTGLLRLPRIDCVEPEFYQEIEVIYGIGSKGQLVLKGFMEDSTAPWPSISLDAPVKHYTGATQAENGSGIGTNLSSSPTSGWLPSSPGSKYGLPMDRHRFAAGQPVELLPDPQPGETPMPGGKK